MRRLLQGMLVGIVMLNLLGCGGSGTGPNTGPAGGEVPKEQKESDDLMHGGGAAKK